MKISVINGPNLNLLGSREPEVYGHHTLKDVEALCQKTATRIGATATCMQSNAEAALIDAIHGARDQDGLVINAGAYSHTSIAIYDALAALTIPIIEVHISQVYQREEFRHHSYVSRQATGLIVGLGSQGYALAIEALADLIKSEGE